MQTSYPLSRKNLRVTGVVQGVGFRPFVYRLARQHRLSGWVCNTSDGVEIEVQGPAGSLESFIRRLQREAPALARIAAVEFGDREPREDDGFAILASRSLSATEALIPADIATCEACAAETTDPADRRYLYPFTNCTDCGPRFTIIRQVPYDRPFTTMADFAMCPECRAEYENPGDRRFHAEPIACPVCGPRVWLEAAGLRQPGDAIQLAASLLRAGKIVALKGLGGFHLAADAANPAAVESLRTRKGRGAKPFALMVRDLAAADRLCLLGDTERTLLLSRERPVVLARRRAEAPVSPQVAPGLKHLGLMLPYTPLHLLLLAQGPEALVMTSGNLSEEPLAFEDEAARTKLRPLADAFLMHDRPIQVPCDDSVVRPLPDGAAVPLRRARGFVPNPVYLPLTSPPILGVGAEQKNTFCLAAGNVAILSQHIGDLDTVETQDYFRLAIEHFKALCQKDPAVVAHDLHPDYFSTRYALGLPGVRRLGVQHHHAHIAACLAENRRRERCLGIALDGTGYGPDGTVWGGEILLADLAAFSRAGHFSYVRLPGGEAAVRDPRRLAVSYLYEIYGAKWPAAARRLDLSFAPLEESILSRQLSGALPAPLTSSAGRLFDAVAAALNICRLRTYEGEPALALEMAANETETGYYPADFRAEQNVLNLDTVAIFRQALAEREAGVPAAIIAARFHNSLVRLLAAVCERLREQTGLNLVALAGGVFQNALLLTRLKGLLSERGFEVLTHSLTPPNDGSISLGQVAVAAARIEKGEKA